MLQLKDTLRTAQQHANSNTRLIVWQDQSLALETVFYITFTDTQTLMIFMV